MKINILFFAVILLSFTSLSCKFTKKVYDTSSKAVNNLDVFTYQDDIKLGQQVKDEIAKEPTKYPILDENQNKEIYAYIRSLRDIVLNTNQLTYKDKFSWEVKIIKDDKTLNAFATPGGFIYVYTGLIKYLDSEDQLLGVLGHEIAHADRRHSTKQLTKNLGVTILLNAALGDKQSVQQIVGAVVGLQFSRTNEAEADEFSVKYLCGTPYNAGGAAGFFKKMQDAPSMPEFLSTHPSPKNRVKDIESLKTTMACGGTRTNQEKYTLMKKLLN